jgi:hypothetical protein
MAPLMAAGTASAFSYFVAATDRAFRALARAEPEVILEVLRIALPGFMPNVSVDDQSVEDPKLDLPPPIEADLVARSEEAVLHVEGQGYGDLTFEQRLFRYHLVLVLRHPTRRVRTVALWLARPPQGQRFTKIERDGITIEVETVVLGELSAAALLENPATACFAAGADAGGMADGELCRRVAEALRAQHAPWQRLLLCLALARANGRYRAMIDAMTEAQLEIPIIEDFVHMGREEGFKKGIEQGIEQGLRSGILELLVSRGLAPDTVQRRRVEAEHDVDRLMTWLRRAAAASRVDDLFVD